MFAVRTVSWFIEVSVHSLNFGCTTGGMDSFGAASAFSIHFPEGTQILVLNTCLITKYPVYISDDLPR